MVNASVAEILSAFILVIGSASALKASVSVHDNYARAGCAIDLNSDLPTNQPLILTSDLQFALPSKSSGRVEFNAGEDLVLACPGGTLSATGEAYSTVTCVSGTTFEVSGSSNSLKNLGCSKKIASTAKKTGSSCYGNNIVAEIGFDAANKWLPLITVCFDEKTYNTLYSSHTVYGQSMAGAESESDRPSFAEGGFYPDVDANHLYTQAQQTATVAELLDSQSLATQYIQPNTNFFFSRGHLAPDADFIYGAWQFATYYFINVLPQWQAFNGANWMYAESGVRDYAEKTGLELEVHTGSFGVTTLDDANNNPVEIYLNPGGSVDRIPAPKYYWKVLYDRSSNRGVALVGLNDPYAVNPTDELCKDICSQLSWVDWSVNDVDSGYMYCCEVDDLRKSVPYVPVSGVGGILD